MCSRRTLDLNGDRSLGLIGQTDACSRGFDMIAITISRPRLPPHICCSFHGSPVYYVILQCGTKEYRSRMSKGEDDNALWNQKFVFEFPMSQWKKLTCIKFKIMDKEFFNDGGFVGETIIHLGGIISEGRERGYMEVKPSLYNVVLDDDTFKGELKLGFKFIASGKLLQRNAWEVNIENKNGEEPMISPILNVMKLPLLRFLLYCFRKTAKYQQLKEN